MIRPQIAALLLVCLFSCMRPAPGGILTLAPAGMEVSDGCVANADGTLDMPAGAQAQKTTYLAAGPATLTLTAHLVSDGQPSTLRLYFDGQALGDLRLASTQETVRAFAVAPRRAGPYALRVQVSADGSQPSTAMVHFKQLVVTQP